MVQCSLYTAVTAVGARDGAERQVQPGPDGVRRRPNEGGDWIIFHDGSSDDRPDAHGQCRRHAVQRRHPKPRRRHEQQRRRVDGLPGSVGVFTGHTGLSGDSYSAHLGSSGITCQKSFIIFIGAASKNGEPEVGNGDAGGASGLASAGATTAQQAQIDTSYIGAHRGDEGAWPDEWARFLYQNGLANNVNDKQNIVTYTIAATGGTQDDDYVQLLQSAANSGGGKSFVGSDVNSMTQALLAIFNEIQAVNSVFASSSLPVSANSQGTYLNQVFIGMFRPDKDAGPRWLGNLKQYQFGVGGTAASPTLFLADANGGSAISAAATGFISPNAVSFWTKKDTATLPDSIGGFYLNNPNSVGGAFDSPDGELVEKGGAAKQLRLGNLQDNYATNATTPRHLYTCLGTSCIGGAQPQRDACRDQQHGPDSDGAGPDGQLFVGVVDFAQRYDGDDGAVRRAEPRPDEWSSRDRLRLVEHRAQWHVHHHARQCDDVHVHDRRDRPRRRPARTPPAFRPRRRP